MNGTEIVPLQNQHKRSYFGLFICNILIRKYTFLKTSYSILKLKAIRNTVEPVLSGPVLSGHPLLSGQLSKSRKLLPLITVILTSIKRSPLLSGRGHPLLSPDELFLLS